MHEMKFIQDFAIIMSLAGLVNILFHRFKQPIVLGYILVGVIAGPYTSPFAFINDKEIIKIFAELGAIFLMFSLGLEFNLRKLAKVRVSTLVAAVLEMLVIIFIGYHIGKFFAWGNIDALFLGAMLVISSTTVIVKALNDLALSKEHFAQLIFGVLAIEDILAIAVLALLTSIGISNSVSTMEVTITFGKLLLFLAVSLCIGILIVPRFLSYVAKFQRHEMLLLAVLGLCFGFCLLIVKLHYSIELGAFIIGAIIAESRHIKAIEHLIEPLCDMFSAVFFVAIGLMLDLNILVAYTIPIIIITVAVVIGKISICSFGMFITGQGARTGLRVGMGLAQIGEFSFIIASLGLSFNVTSKFLYPIAVAVSALTTLFTPYLIKFSDPLANYLKKALPTYITDSIKGYTTGLQKSRIDNQNFTTHSLIKKILFNIFFNLTLVIVLFISVPYIHRNLLEVIFHVKNTQLSKVILLGSALTFSLPFLMAIYGKLNLLNRLLVEVGVKKVFERHLAFRFRKMMRGAMPLFFISVVLLGLTQLCYSFLPSVELLVMIVGTVLILAVGWRNWFMEMHSRLQVSFTQAIKKSLKEQL